MRSAPPNPQPTPARKHFGGSTSNPALPNTLSFTTPKVYELLNDVACTHKVNVRSVEKLRSILHGIFKYAINTGAFPGKNPTDEVMIPESATKPKPTVAATRDEVQAILTGLKGKLVARAAVAVMAFTGVRPGEARGLR